jgi:1-acyl-sn-glycerol-3-phosphate acyltransferase
LLYRLLKTIAPAALHFYCRQLQINAPHWLKAKGPILLAANHPNSFLDAIVLCTLFKQPIYSLARGDAFKGNFISKLLMKLNMFPVYRLSEGSENVAGNYDTFNNCLQLFKDRKIVLIFSEGLCINEWHLRKLKKGTARLAMAAWQQNIPLTVLPVGINYSSFSRFGKNIHLYFGQPLTSTVVAGAAGEGAAIRQFNAALQLQLQAAVYEIPNTALQLQRQYFQVQQPLWKKALLMLPAIVGYIVHAPLYWLARSVYHLLIKDSDHFDAVIIGVLMLLYPLFLLAVFGLFCLYGNCIIAGALLFVLPFCAWSLLQIKSQF